MIEYDREWLYHEMQDAWADLHEQEKRYSAFSMFETVSDKGSNWRVSAPDFESTSPLVAGMFDVIIVDNGATIPIKNPTWKDIAKFFTIGHDGHHVFLENVEIDKKAKTITLQTGS
jgi:hypothetical protein